MELQSSIEEDQLQPELDCVERYEAYRDDLERHGE